MSKRYMSKVKFILTYVIKLVGNSVCFQNGAWKLGIDAPRISKWMQATVWSTALSISYLIFFLLELKNRTNDQNIFPEI